jgi:hypothetical protein
VSPRTKRTPARKHLKAVSDKEQRQYEHIKESAQKSGRYGKRAAEVAARTVMKEHKVEGAQKGEVIGLSERNGRYRAYSRVFETG